MKDAFTNANQDDITADDATVANGGGDQQGTQGEPGSAPVAEQQQKLPVRPLSTTTLLFQAPDIQPLPPLRRGRNDFDDRDDRDERDDIEDRDDRVREERDSQDEDVSRVRRRSRRRSGEDRSGTDDPENTVIKVRTPREREPELITEPQRIKGSTRLEAKKQRRRDGRDAGRRRPVVTEAEFLARRESVDRTMVVRSKDDRIQIGVLEDGVLVEHYVARAQEASLIGNVYLGRVQNVLPSMEAAFVDIGRGRNAVLYSGEVDWDAAETGNQPRRIELALKPGDKVLVQVTKDPVGHKGARLTSQISLPGRYLVYVPNGSMNGISRKLPDTERARLKKILKEVLPENTGVIVRTAAEGATEEQLTLDVNRLTSQWAEIQRQVETQSAPYSLHSEPDLLIKIIRDVFNEDFTKLVIAGDDAQATIENYLRSVAPDLIDRVERYEGSVDAFDQFRISEQIEKALDRKVWLPSGGSLVIDRTEAMTVVDVNTGKFVGSGGNLEETVTKNNLEAAEEIVRQLRLRDIGGIIVVDFIDMVLETNRDLVLRRLLECLSRDRTKHQVAEVTSLGLVQMTRKKLGLGLLESFSENCEVCAGRGIIVHHDPVTKHRQTPQPEMTGRRRGKGGNTGAGNGNGGGANTGNGNGNGGSNGNNGNGGRGGDSAPAPKATHAITEDARNALAKIATSTIAVQHEKHAEDPTVPDVAVEEPAVVPAAAAPAAAAPSADSAAPAPADQAAEGEPRVQPAQGAPTAQAPQSGSGRRGGRNRRASASGRSPQGLTAEVITTPVTTAEPVAPTAGNSGEGAHGESAGSDTSDAPADAPVAILDIPLAPAHHAQPKVSRQDAEQLLGSVLDALPEPKEPGKGRSRSRRVSTATLSAPILPPSGE
ncbi:Rne/Rng family ribonuclease [Planctomonas deserti]|uniref:Rne/Rng family ribonuclease n=1 Tax=Planctomonas deserti TaxID=2144185 RepID=UPI000D381CE9